MLNAGDRVRVTRDIDPQDGINPILKAGSKGTVTRVHVRRYNGELLGAFPYDVVWDNYLEAEEDRSYPMAVNEIELDF